MPLSLDSCISGIFTPGNIGSSTGLVPVVRAVPSLETPDTYDPAAVTYSLNFARFYDYMLRHYGEY